MTTTSTTPAVDDLMPAARELAGHRRAIPSPTGIRTALNIGWSKASEIHERLRVEAEDRRARQRRAMRSLASRKITRGLAARPLRVLPAALPAAAPDPAPAEPSPQVMIATAATSPAAVAGRPARLSRWPLLLLALPAFVAIWAGWVDLGRLTGFGVVHPLPGILDDFSINTAITLPVGLETYAAYALRVWLSGAVPPRARKFARWSAVVSLLLGFAGQASYHLMIAAGMQHAPWPITLAVSGVPVAVLGAGAALWHMVHND
jgi:hypothetical protein